MLKWPWAPRVPLSHCTIPTPGPAGGRASAQRQSETRFPVRSYASVQKCPAATWSRVRKLPSRGSEVAETCLWKGEVKAFCRRASSKTLELTAGPRSGRSALSQQVMQALQEQNTGISVLTKGVQVSDWGTDTRAWVKAECWVMAPLSPAPSTLIRKL